MDRHIVISMQAPAKQHRFGVSSLAFSVVDNGNFLYTGGRDGTIRGFDVQAREGKCKGPVVGTDNVFDEHTDWVNDLLVIG